MVTEIENNKSGYLIKQENVQALATKIIILLKNEDLAHKMGEEGYETIKNKFSIKQMVDGRINIYQKLV